jgi:hypothetical protein
VIGFTKMRSDSKTVGEAMLARNLASGLPPDGGESANTFRIYIGPLSVRLPNPPARRRAVFFHDANHVLTDYDNVFSRGEMEIAAFEIASGCGPYLFVWLINLNMFALGLLVRPGRLFRAFLRGRRSTGSVYCQTESRSAISAMTIRELRSRLGIDGSSAPSLFGDRLLFATWGCTAVVMLFLFAAVLLVLGKLAASILWSTIDK